MTFGPEDSEQDEGFNDNADLLKSAGGSASFSDDEEGDGSSSAAGSRGG